MNKEAKMNNESAQESTELLGFDSLCRELTLEEILLVSAGGSKSGGAGAA